MSHTNQITTIDRGTSRIAIVLVISRQCHLIEGYRDLLTELLVMLVASFADRTVVELWSFILNEPFSIHYFIAPHFSGFLSS